MGIETNPRKPVNTPLRARCFTGGLLLATLGMALVSAHGTRGAGLGDPVSPPDWRISFAPPANWVDDGTRLTANRTRMHYFRGPAHRSFGVARMQVDPALGAEELCLDALDEVDAAAIAHLARDVRVTERTVAGWSAVQLDWTPTVMGQVFGQHVYLVGMLAPDTADGMRDAYVMELRSPPPLRPVDRKTWKMLLEGVNTKAGQP
jgi:hypothetical protein